MSLKQIKVELQDFMGSDRSIAEAAWTSSYGLKSKSNKTDEDIRRVVETMAQNGHGTPFESVVFRFWYRWPIFVDRQHMTHRMASHNGLSGRYRTLPKDYYTLAEDVKKIFDEIRDSNECTDIWSEILGKDNCPCRDCIDLEGLYYETAEIAKRNYGLGIEFLKKAEERGLINNKKFKRAREVWRGQTTVSSMVERVTTLNLRSFVNYMRHRLSPHAQFEISFAAGQMLHQVKKAGICPVAIESLEKNNWLLAPEFDRIIE